MFTGTTEFCRVGMYFRYNAMYFGYSSSPKAVHEELCQRSTDLQKYPVPNIRNVSDLPHYEHG